MAANLQPITSDGGFTSGGNININNGAEIVTAINEDLNIVVQDEEDDGWALKQTITDGIGNNLSQTTLDSSSFLIELGSDQWQFDGNTLQVTSDTTIRGFNANVVTQALVSGGSPVASLQVVNGVNDPNIFATFDATSTGANIKIYNGGSNGGTEYAWQFDNDGNLTVPGDTTVSTAESTGGAAGNSISIIAGAADQSDYYTTAGGNVNITGGLGATDDGGGGGPGGSVNISAGVSSDPVGNAGNVVINTGGTSYTFNELTLNVTTNPPASPAPILNGFGIIKAPEFTNGTGNLTINANSKIWTFDSTGTFTTPGNIIMADGATLKGTGASPAPKISGFDSASFGGNLSAANLTVANLTANATALFGPSASANFTRFPNAQVVISNVAAGIQQNESGNIGLISETTANSANTSVRGVGVYGVGYTSSGASADGVDGEGHVSDTNDTGTATGVRGYSYDAHVGGVNIGVYASALNGATNYALYMKHGNIISDDPQTWTLADNNASALSLNAAGKTGILDIVTTNGAEGVTMSGYANVTGNVTGGNISTTGNISGNTNGFTIGYLNIPQVSASNTTLALTDAGKHYYSTTAGNFTLTIPNNATTSFATGTAINIVVQAAGNILANADTGVTLYMAGNSTAANRVVGAYGMATLLKVASDTWFINGTGVS